MAGIAQVARHGRAHVAEPDECNFHWRHFKMVVERSRQPGWPP
jgi:hypothetical protein